MFLRILRKKHASNFETNPSKKKFKQKHHSQKRIISTRGKAKKTQCICIITNCRANVLHQFLNRHRLVPFFSFLLVCHHICTSFFSLPFRLLPCCAETKNFISFSFFTVGSISVCYVCVQSEIKSYFSFVSNSFGSHFS